MHSKAKTADDYIASLPEHRRAAVKKVRALLKRRMPKGYREMMGFGMIMYSIPLERFPDTYNGQPLCYAALASQKNYLALYLMCAYGSPSLRKKLEAGFKKAGKKVDMGKSCIRFQSPDDLPLDVIGDVVAAVPPEKYLEAYRKSRAKA
jgi:Domain of unknown function (DU1801)